LGCRKVTIKSRATRTEKDDNNYFYQARLDVVIRQVFKPQ